MHFIDTVRVSAEARDRLIALKRKTGIQQWSVLCRWALCLSLADARLPSSANVATDSNIDMPWRTFTGAGYEDIYEALVKARCIQDGTEPTRENMVMVFKLHLHRGIGYLTSLQRKSGINLLVSRVVHQDELKEAATYDL